MRESADHHRARDRRAPPESPVPEPRGTMGRPEARASRTTSTTSAVDAGQHDQVGPGPRPWVSPSHS